MAMMTFNMLVERKWLTEKATCGTITAGDLHFYTLEPPTRHDDVKPRAIPAGVYPLTIRFSPNHGRLVPHVECVPGFYSIEIHIGNTAKDTLGCTLVGRTNPSPDFIGASHAAFDDLFGRLFAAAAEYTGGQDEHLVYHVGLHEKMPVLVGAPSHL